MTSFDMSPLQLFLIISTSIIGSGFIYSGKKRQNKVLFYTGILLCVQGYFIFDGVLLALSTLILVALPFLIKR